LKKSAKMASKKSIKSAAGITNKALGVVRGSTMTELDRLGEGNSTTVVIEGKC
jgi:hypothetical protein